MWLLTKLTTLKVNKHVSECTTSKKKAEVNCKLIYTIFILFLILGGLFDMTDTIQEIAFRYAVDRVNSDREIMPRSRLAAQIERIPKQDSFYASKQGKGPFICTSFKHIFRLFWTPPSPY